MIEHRLLRVREAIGKPLIDQIVSVSLWYDGSLKEHKVKVACIETAVWRSGPLHEYYNGGFRILREQK